MRAHGIRQAGYGVEPRRTLTKRPLTRQHHPVCLANLVWVSRDGHVRRQTGPVRRLLQRPLGGREVAAAIIDNGDPHHSTPLVDGITSDARGSVCTAIRSARATALNAASATWWALVPARCVMCTVARLFIAKARKNS